MKKILLSLFTLLLCQGLAAQSHIRIHYKDGSHADVALSSIDSLTIVSIDSTATAATLTGTWVWANRERGYYEVLTLNDDYTYTGYDNYFDYGFDSQTFGFYSNYSSMLTLWSNGYGYQWRYQWFITALTENSLSVMTRNGPFTYYRLLLDVVHLSRSSSPINIGEGEELLFTDGVIVDSTSDGRLQPLSSGTTYILKRNISTNQTWAVRVVVG
jgi:hypothetical protein